MSNQTFWPNEDPEELLTPFQTSIPLHQLLLHWTNWEIGFRREEPFVEGEFYSIYVEDFHSQETETVSDDLGLIITRDLKKLLRHFGILHCCEIYVRPSGEFNTPWVPVPEWNSPFTFRIHLKFKS